MPYVCRQTAFCRTDSANCSKGQVGRLPNEVRGFHANFTYKAGRWSKPRGVITKVEWHPGELIPRVGFIVTNMSCPAERVVAFYNKRGTCEQWIKEGKGRVRPNAREKGRNSPATIVRGCPRCRKTLIFTPLRESFGESRLNASARDKWRRARSWVMISIVIEEQRR